MKSNNPYRVCSVNESKIQNQFLSCATRGELSNFRQASLCSDEATEMTSPGDPLCIGIYDDRQHYVKRYRNVIVQKDMIKLVSSP